MNDSPKFRSGRFLPNTVTLALISLEAADMERIELDYKDLCILKHALVLRTREGEAPIEASERLAQLYLWASRQVGRIDRGRALCADEVAARARGEG